MEADQILLTDIYAAGESPIPGVSSEKLAQEMKHENAQYFLRDDKSSQKIVSMLKDGDVFITLGAGDGWKLGLDVLERI
jgi:UDP-N-acetylmuramate--alanine ligase